MKATLFLCTIFIATLFVCSHGFGLNNTDIYKYICQNIENRPSLLFPATCMNEEKLRTMDSLGNLYSSQNLNPVFLIPGLAGSVLETKSVNSNPPSWCEHTYDWKHTWVDIPSFLPYNIECLFHILKIGFDKQTNQFFNQKGVLVRPKDFGGVKGIDYLDNGLLGSQPLFGYFAPFITALKGAGYEVGKNLFGIPYDWRQYSNQNDFYMSIKSLIENAYATNGNRPVHIVAHSMGNLHTTVFLSKVGKEWKDKYIASYFAVSAPWSGAPMSLRTLVSGNDIVETIIGIPLLDGLKIRDFLSQTGSLPWLLPDSAYWNKTVLASTPRRKYFGSDIKDLLRDSNSSISWDILLRGNRLSQFSAPGVKTHCVLSYGFPTEVSYTYESTFDKKPIIKYEDGDGIVPIVSLRDCYKWSDKQTQEVHKFELEYEHHNTILASPEFIRYFFKNVQ